MADVNALPETKRSFDGGSRPNHAGQPWGLQTGRLTGLTLSRKPVLVDGAYSGSFFPLQFFCPLIQFVCVESLVTALVDMYPRVFRKKNRREVLILGVSVISFLIGLVMLTEVRVWEASRWGQVRKGSKGGQLPPVRWSKFRAPGPAPFPATGNTNRQVPPPGFGH